ncbi:uncharacterized protein DS421_12g365890 [Arachis hypogaea]|nr:uncharacterized protein DS421_12g365890 [Arachis hypogaea]
MKWEYLSTCYCQSACTLLHSYAFHYLFQALSLDRFSIMAIKQTEEKVPPLANVHDLFLLSPLKYNNANSGE